jgi:hypothetical protein
VKHHHIALVTLAVALVLDVILGVLYATVTPGMPVWHGLYCALANAVTDGGDVTPANGAGYIIQAIEYATVVPLFGASFSLFTSALSSVHLRPVHARLARLAGEEEDPR